MEGVKNGTISNNNKKKHNTIVRFNGGGGIGGIVVLGGAIAFAALVTFVATKRNKTKPTTRKDEFVESDLYREFKSKSYRADIDVDDGETENGCEGLQLLVQLESEPIVHLNPCCNKSNDKAEIGFDELITTQNSIMEDIGLSETNGVKETEPRQNGDQDNLSKSDLTNPANIISLCIGKGDDNENHILQVTEVEEEGEAEPFLKLIQEEKQGEEISDTSSTVENPAKESTEADKEEYGEDDDDDEDEEGSKGSSEETRDSSVESNADPIWPTETLENLSSRLEGKIFSHFGLFAEKIVNKEATDKKDIDNKHYELVAAKYEKRSQIMQENVNNRVGIAAMMMLLRGTIMLLLIASLIIYYPRLFHGDSAL